MKNLLKKIPFLTALGLASALYAGCSEPATSTCSFTQRNGQTIEYACGEGYRCALTQAICITTNCGNGVVDGEEECDDGNLQNGDGCSQDCRREVCGYGILDPIKWDEEAKNYVVGEFFLKNFAPNFKFFLNSRRIFIIFFIATDRF